MRHIWDIGYCYGSREIGYVEDIYAVTRYVKKKFPGLPLVLYGHSMGSLGVRVCLQRHDDAYDGLVVAGCPAYNSMTEISRIFLFLLERVVGERFRSPLLQCMVSDNFERPFAKEGRQFAWLAAREAVAEAFERDPLCRFTYTLNGLSTLLNLMHRTYKEVHYPVSNPYLPILFISGMDDPCYICDRKWAQAVNGMKSSGYCNVMEKRFPGMRHEIHNEEGREKVYQELYVFCQLAKGLKK